MINGGDFMEINEAGECWRQTGVETAGEGCEERRRWRGGGGGVDCEEGGEWVLGFPDFSRGVFVFRNR